MAVDNKLDSEVLQPKIEQEPKKFEQKEVLESENQSEIDKVSEPVAPDQSIARPVILPTPKQDEIITPKEEEEIEEVEHILEEDLGDIYKELDPKTQQDFKEQGEVAAKTIIMLLHKVKIRTRLIMKAISKWLTVIPGINRNFVEQESKIKTDQIVDMHEHENEHKNQK